MIEEMIRAGYNVEQAIDKVYKCFGTSQSVTRTSDYMISDKKNAGRYSGLKFLVNELFLTCILLFVIYG